MPLPRTGLLHIPEPPCSPPRPAPPLRRLAGPRGGVLRAFHGVPGVSRDDADAGHHGAFRGNRRERALGTAPDLRGMLWLPRRRRLPAERWQPYAVQSSAGAGAAMVFSCRGATVSLLSSLLFCSVDPKECLSTHGLLCSLLIMVGGIGFSLSPPGKAKAVGKAADAAAVKHQRKKES